MSYLGNNPNKGSFFQQKLAVDASRIEPLLTKELQEQQGTIEALTARIVTLENA